MSASGVETLIYENGEPTSVADARSDSLWVSAAEFQLLSGWELRSEGFCLGEVCIPVPPGRESEFVSSAGDRVSLRAIAELRGQPVVCDDEHAVCVIGRAAASRLQTVGSLAPEFVLPDLDGVEHRLSDMRGSKVILLSWASW